MAKTRALITQTERDRIAGREDVEDIKRYQAISRVRRRIEDELTEDVRLLAEHHPDLLNEVRDVVCEEEPTSVKREGAVREQSTEPADPSPTAAAHVIDEPAGVDRDHLRDELAGQGELLEARVDAIVAMYDLLREKGEATKGDFLDVVNAERVRYDSPESVWSNMVKGKDTLSSLSGVQKPPRGRSEWRYTEGR